MLATTTALKKICPNNQFEVRINDRKILRAMAVYSGFPEEDIEKVFITVDKMDKIGVDGVRAELVENGYSEETADKYLELMGQVTNDADGVRRMGEILSGVLEDGAAENLAGDHGYGHERVRRRLRTEIRSHPGPRHGLLHRHDL